MSLFQTHFCMFYSGSPISLQPQGHKQYKAPMPQSQLHDYFRLKNLR